jgi:hypothetical protein
MAMQRADIMGTRHTLNITYPSPQETLQGTPTVLPTSEPASATFSYTVAAGDLPTFDGAPYSIKYAPLLFAGGKNTDASNARSLCYRIKKNGVSIATATNISVTANQYWTLIIFHANLLGIVAGDTIEVFLWQITANALNWDYQSYSVNFSRLFVDNPNKILSNVKYTFDSVNYPILALGNPSVQGSGSYNIKELSSTSNQNIFLATPTTTIFAYKQASLAGLGSLEWGDTGTWQSILTRNHATLRPHYNNNQKITKIEWTPTNVGV